MHALLSHTEIQAGVFPFIVALITAELFQRLRLSGLAVIAGFAVTVYFAGDFDLEPLTANRKVIWLGISASAIAIPLSLLAWPYWRPILSILAAGAAVWTNWHVLMQQSIADELLWAGGCAAYAGWMIFWFDGLQNKPVAAGSAGLALGIGTGIAALQSASVLPGKFGLALGSASVAYLLIQAVTNSRLSCGYSFTLPLSLIAGLTGCLAVIGTHQPWYSLLSLGLIPLVAQIPIPEKWAIWLQILVLCVVTFACAGGGVYLAWQRPF